jgi:hypothetical protein
MPCHEHKSYTAPPPPATHQRRDVDTRPARHFHTFTLHGALELPSPFLLAHRRSYSSAITRAHSMHSLTATGTTRKVSDWHFSQSIYLTTSPSSQAQFSGAIESSADTKGPLQAKETQPVHRTRKDFNRLLYSLPNARNAKHFAPSNRAKGRRDPKTQCAV